MHCRDDPIEYTTLNEWPLRTTQQRKGSERVNKATTKQINEPNDSKNRATQKLQSTLPVDACQQSTQEEEIRMNSNHIL